VANSGSNDISAFSVDSSSGSLTPVANSPISIGGSPINLMVSSGGVVYATYLGANPDAYVSAYAADPNSGVLSPVAGSPYLVSGPPGPTIPGPSPYSAIAFAIDPKANFFYAGFISRAGLGEGAFAIESINANGALAPVANSPFYAGPIGSLAIDLTGKFLYASDPLDSNIQGYTIDSASGVLTPLPSSPFDRGIHASSVLGAIDPSNHFLYVTNSYSSPYSIDPATGALTQFLSGTTLSINNAAPVAFSTTP
jgi:6-phosphogluconolactonase (cycloisomerase 2 family)